MGSQPLSGTDIQNQVRPDAKIGVLEQGPQSIGTVTPANRARMADDHMVFVLIFNPRGKFVQIEK